MYIHVNVTQHKIQSKYQASNIKSLNSKWPINLKPQTPRAFREAKAGTKRRTNLVNGETLYTNSNGPLGGFGRGWRAEFYKVSPSKLDMVLVQTDASGRPILSSIGGVLPVTRTKHQICV